MPRAYSEDESPFNPGRFSIHGHRKTFAQKSRRLLLPFYVAILFLRLQLPYLLLKVFHTLADIE